MFLEFFSKTVCPRKEQKNPQYHNQYKPHKTPESPSTKNRQTISGIRSKPNSQVLCLCREKRCFFDKPRLQRRPKQSCRPSDSEWRHLEAVAKSRLILSPKDLPKPRFLHKIPAYCLEFCAFAERNAVSLAKTDCKGGKSVGRNDRLWHLKNPALPKAPSQSPRIPL